VLSGFAELPVCVAYRLPSGEETSEFPAHQSDFHGAKPVYEKLPGWRTPLDGDLADAARDYVEFVQQTLDVEIGLVGTGAARERVVALR
jgi:adenylosuccinate synthase